MTKGAAIARRRRRRRRHARWRRPLPWARRRRWRREARRGVPAPEGQDRRVAAVHGGRVAPSRGGAPLAQLVGARHRARLVGVQQVLRADARGGERVGGDHPGGRGRGGLVHALVPRDDRGARGSVRRRRAGAARWRRRPQPGARAKTNGGLPRSKNASRRFRKWQHGFVCRGTSNDVGSDGHQRHFERR